MDRQTERHAHHNKQQPSQGEEISVNLVRVSDRHCVTVVQCWRMSQQRLFDCQRRWSAADKLDVASSVQRTCEATSTEHTSPSHQRRSTTCPITCHSLVVWRSGSVVHFTDQATPR